MIRIDTIEREGHTINIGNGLSNFVKGKCSNVVAFIGSDFVIVVGSMVHCGCTCDASILTSLDCNFEGAGVGLIHGQVEGGSGVTASGKVNHMGTGRGEAFSIINERSFIDTDSRIQFFTIEDRNNGQVEGHRAVAAIDGCLVVRIETTFCITSVSAELESGKFSGADGFCNCIIIDRSNNQRESHDAVTTGSGCFVVGLTTGGSPFMSAEIVRKAVCTDGFSDVILV